MKHTLLLTLCVALVISMLGCSIGSTPAPTVTPNCGVHVGMSLEEFYDVYPVSYLLLMTSYLLIEDDSGNPVVLTYGKVDGIYQITSMEAYDKNAIACSKKTFYAIEAGMTVQEVISLVGIPDNCSDFGTTNTLWWSLADSDESVSILFYVLPDDSATLILEDVVLHDKNGSASIINHRYIPFVD